MACKDCDRFSDCKYKINSPTWSELARGTERYISGEDCPKKWQDKKVEDMTDEQCREAVKELREKLLSTTESKSAEENMVQTGLREDASEIYKEIMDNLPTNEPMYKKPPLGCKPSWLSSCERIEELSEAITRDVNGAVTRDANGVHKDTSNVKKWATEILYQCEIMEKC